MLPNYFDIPYFKKFLFQSQINENSDANSKYPKITVVTPSYNQAIYLERTILSILNQNYPNLEYIIMDGGSTDDSVEVIKKYEKYITYWESGKDGGQAAAINKGFKMATGDLVTFQNSDDVFVQGAFELVAKSYLSNPENSFFYGNVVMIDEHDEPFEYIKTIPFWSPALIYDGMQCHNQCYFFKKELLQKFGYLNESYRFCFDYEIMSRYGFGENVKGKLIENLWGAFRIHSASKTSNISQVGLQEHQTIKEIYQSKLKSFLPEKLNYYYCRIRKVLYFLLKGDFEYIRYRKNIVMVK